MLKRLLCVLLLLTPLLASTVFSYVTLPPGKRPVNVDLSFYINDITDVNEGKESVALEATVALGWHDQRLAFSAKKLGTKIKYFSENSARNKLDDIWWPHIEIMNNRGRTFKSQVLRMTITDKGAVHYEERFHIIVSSELDLRKFPFDSQKLLIHLESFSYNAKQVAFIMDPTKSHFAKTRPLEEWKITHSNVNVSIHHDRRLDDKFSRYTLQINYARYSNYYIYQILLPMALIVLLSFSTFWMRKSPLVNRVSVSLTCVLTLIVFQWRIFTTMPKISYHTFMDFFLLLSFIMACLTIVASIIITNIAYDAIRKQRLVRLFRWSFPIAYFLGIGFSVLFFVIW